tara:strand:+ start:9115 stop:10080 length:966 start_codon:yes stop_codon:yes gene_type:complete
MIRFLSYAYHHIGCVSHIIQENAVNSLYRLTLPPLALLAASAAAQQAEPTSAADSALHLSRTLGISLEEAEARMRLADRLAVFQLRVRSDPDFAGLYLEHEPKAQAVVLFKGDAAAKLKRYVGDDAFVPRSVDYSLADLSAAETEAKDAFKAAGLALVGTERDIEANRVLLHVVDDAAAKAAIAAGRLKLSPAVALDVVGDDSIPRPQSAGAVTHFPQARDPSGAAMRALLTGTLFVKDGCLRVGSETGESRLVLWPSSARLAEDAGKLVVRDGAAGGALTVGAAVSLSGGGTTEPPPPGYLLEGIPRACTGPYWIAAKGW